MEQKQKIVESVRQILYLGFRTANRWVTSAHLQIQSLCGQQHVSCLVFHDGHSGVSDAQYDGSTLLFAR